MSHEGRFRFINPATFDPNCTHAPSTEKHLLFIEEGKGEIMHVLIFGLWCIYYYTIGQVVFYVEYRLAKRKANRQWREFLKKL